MLLYKHYNVIMERLNRSLNIFVNKDELKFLQLYLIYIKN